MTITTIKVQDPGNPQEVQAWLNANPNATVSAAFVDLPYFYVVTNP